MGEVNLPVFAQLVSSKLVWGLADLDSPLRVGLGIHQAEEWNCEIQPQKWVGSKMGFRN